jgi:hypothetical protein
MLPMNGLQLNKMDLIWLRLKNSFVKIVSDHLQGYEYDLQCSKRNLSPNLF